MNTKKINNVMGFLFVVLIVVVVFLFYKYQTTQQSQVKTNAPAITNAPVTIVSREEVITPTRGVPPTVAIVKNNKVIILEAVVEMNENGYNPTTVEVSIGGQVRFTNTSKESVMGPKGEDWGGILIKPNLSFTQMFKTAGTYKYSDINNSTFKGEVVVN